MSFLILADGQVPIPKHFPTILLSRLMKKVSWGPPSLLAGKLHALLSRPYVKGRDLFDLVWYLTDRTWPEPNFTFLNNALAQTRRPGPKLTVANWRRIVMKRMEDIHWDRAVKDVSPFLERSQDVNLLTLENVRKLLLHP